MARELRRLNMNMPVDLIARVDEYAERMSINRSSAVNVLCNMALDSQKVVNDLGELMKLIKVEQEKQEKLIKG